MKKLIYLIFIFFAFNANSQESMNISCSNFMGSHNTYVNGNLRTMEDSYSSVTMHFSVPLPFNMSNPVNIRWEGNNTMNVKGMPLMNSPDGWFSFVQIHQSVLRTYTIFYKTGVVSLTESQTDILGTEPQLKIYFGSCRDN